MHGGNTSKIPEKINLHFTVGQCIVKRCYLTQFCLSTSKKEYSLSILEDDEDDQESCPGDCLCAGTGAQCV